MCEPGPLRTFQYGDQLSQFSWDWTVPWDMGAKTGNILGKPELVGYPFLQEFQKTKFISLGLYSYFWPLNLLNSLLWLVCCQTQIIPAMAVVLRKQEAQHWFCRVVSGGWGCFLGSLLKAFLPTQALSKLAVLSPPAAQQHGFPGFHVRSEAACSDSSHFFNSLGVDYT